MTPREEKEVEIEKRLVYEVLQLGGLCCKLSVEGLRGFPDRTILWPNGTAEFVELKKKGGTLSKQQQGWIKDLEKRGFRCSVLWSMEQVEKFIEGRK